MCHSSNVNHCSYFGKLTEAHSVLALRVRPLLSKPSPRVFAHSRHGLILTESLLTAAAQYHLPPPPSCPSMLTDRVVAKGPNCPGRHWCAAALWPFESLLSGPPPSLCHSLLRVQSPEQKCPVCTDNWVNPPGLFVCNPKQ